jgi:hypothetical protein
VTRPIGWPATAAVAVTVLAVSFATQWHMGAYAAELGYDEASHYASGLMMHDYLLHGLGTSPVRFLIEWHSHYPLVGIGHWGPLYYGVEAGWMLLAGTSRAAALALSAVVAALTGTVIYAVTARRAGRVLGVLAGLAFVISPIAQAGSGAVMLDLPIALLCLSAALAYAAWLRDGWWGWALAFALLAAAALLVKGNGACLALLPPFVVLIGRRWDLLRRWSFWLPAPVVGVLAGPWYAVTDGQVEAGFRYSWGWSYIHQALRANAVILVGGAGPALLAAGVIGFVAACARQRRADRDLPGGFAGGRLRVPDRGAGGNPGPLSGTRAAAAVDPGRLDGRPPAAPAAVARGGDGRAGPGAGARRGRDGTEAAVRHAGGGGPGLGQPAAGQSLCPGGQRRRRRGRGGGGTGRR